MLKNVNHDKKFSTNMLQNIKITVSLQRVFHGIRLKVIKDGLSG